MEIDIVRIDSTSIGFRTKFEDYETGVFALFSKCFEHYYGNDYQLKRIMGGRAIVYIAMMNSTIVGASYVKRNFRRGGTAVDADYRGQGIAERLVNESLKDFPRQYSILRANNNAMISLLSKFAFVKPKSVAEIRAVVQGEFTQLSDFISRDGYIVFRRVSIRRHAQRESLTLMHNFPIA